MKRRALLRNQTLRVKINHISLRITGTASAVRFGFIILSVLSFADTLFTLGNHHGNSISVTHRKRMGLPFLSLSFFCPSPSAQSSQFPAHDNGDIYGPGRIPHHRSRSFIKFYRSHFPDDSVQRGGEPTRRGTRKYFIPLTPLPLPESSPCALLRPAGNSFGVSASNPPKRI